MSASPALIYPAGDHRLEVANAEQLAQIRHPDMNLVVWRRTPPEHWQGLLERLMRYRVHVYVCLATAEVESRLLAEFSQQCEIEADSIELVRDIDRLAQHFARIANIDQLLLRLEVIRSDECRLFHVDRKPVRLLCTYSGPGFEWLANETVDRAALGHGNNDRISGGRQPFHLETGDVALLKGETWPGNAGNGLVHRSPPLDPGNQRLRLRLDIPEN
mgnify:CR=1 FL=1